MHEFNLLPGKGRFEVHGLHEAYGSWFFNHGLGWACLIVRKWPGPAHVQLRKVKDVICTEYN
jgi:hypothetical protein